MLYSIYRPCCKLQARGAAGGPIAKSVSGGGSCELLAEERAARGQAGPVPRVNPRSHSGGCREGELPRGRGRARRHGTRPAQLAAAARGRKTKKRTVANRHAPRATTIHQTERAPKTGHRGARPPPTVSRRLCQQHNLHPIWPLGGLYKLAGPSTPRNVTRAARTPHDAPQTGRAPETGHRGARLPPPYGV